MSLLDTATEDVVVYPQETVTDADGNTHTRASATGTPARATIQLQDAPAGDAEGDTVGYASREIYRLRFSRSWTSVLGPQSQIAWNGARWAVIGQPRRYHGSARTAHIDYLIERY